MFREVFLKYLNIQRKKERMMSLQQRVCRALLFCLLLLFVPVIGSAAPAATAPPFESRLAGMGAVIPVFSLTSAEIAGDKGAMKIINEALGQKLYTAKYTFGRFVPGNETDGWEVSGLARNQSGVIPIEELVRFGQDKQLKYFLVVENWKINDQNEETCNEICTWSDWLKTNFCNTVCTTAWLVDCGLSVQLVDVGNGKWAVNKQYYNTDTNRGAAAWGEGPQHGVRKALRMNFRRFLADPVELR